MRMCPDTLHVIMHDKLRGPTAQVQAHLLRRMGDTAAATRNLHSRRVQATARSPNARPLTPRAVNGTVTERQAQTMCQLLGAATTTAPS